MDKYPSKGMNTLASKRPDVAKKIMGYNCGGMVHGKKYNMGGMAENMCRGGGQATAGTKFRGVK